MYKFTSDMITYLSQRIGEEMEKFREYNGLSGLHAVNISNKVTQKKIPEQGRIGDFIKDCDELTCSLLADEIWLFVKYDFSCSEQHKFALVELRVAKECVVKVLRLVLEKLALNLWSFLNSEKPKFYYALKEMTTKMVHLPRK